jgi:hypothetical protein
MPKLAEALIQRKDLTERYQRIIARLQASAIVQEGEKPPEDPADLLSEARAIVEAIKRVTLQINKTNSRAKLAGEDVTLMEAIAERDRLSSERNVYRQLANAARVSEPRGYGVTRNEVKWRPTVEISALQKQIDQLSQRYRELDTRIQEANWLVDLVEG